MSYGDTPHGSVMAFKVAEIAGKPVLGPAWMSRDMGYPEPPVVAGGVVFAVSSGANEDQIGGEGKLYDSAFRIQHLLGNAVLYALDARTGKELWSSGDQMKSWTHFSGLGIGSGRVFVATFDGTVYAFGFGN